MNKDKDKKTKKELFEVFKAGSERNRDISIDESFDTWLEAFDYHLFMSEHYNERHEHRETCKIKYPYYFSVGDVEHGCNCTGKLHRYLTTKEIYNLVESIPDEKIASKSKWSPYQDKNGKWKDKDGRYHFKENTSYRIMQHIANFRGETYDNCDENTFCDGSFLERVMHFKGIGTYACGATLKFVEDGKDPNFQQATQKERVLALLKEMIKKRK